MTKTACPACSRAEDLAGAVEALAADMRASVNQHCGQRVGKDFCEEYGCSNVDAWASGIEGALQSYREAAPRDEEREALRELEAAARKFPNRCYIDHAAKPIDDCMWCALAGALARLDAVRAAGRRG